MRRMLDEAKDLETRQVGVELLSRDEPRGIIYPSLRERTVTMALPRLVVVLSRWLGIKSGGRIVASLMAVVIRNGTPSCFSFSARRMSIPFLRKAMRLRVWWTDLDIHNRVKRREADARYSANVLSLQVEM